MSKLRVVFLFASLLFQPELPVVDGMLSPLNVTSQASVVFGTMNVTATSSSSDSLLTISWRIGNITVYEVGDSSLGLKVSKQKSMYENDTMLQAFGTPDTRVAMQFFVTLQPSMDGFSITVEDNDGFAQNEVVIVASECVAGNTSCMISNVSESPCGLGCTASFTCVSGCAGDPDQVNATCLSDATWSELINCQRVCPLPPSIDCDCQGTCRINTTASSLPQGETTTVICPNGCKPKSGTVMCGTDGNLTTTQTCDIVECVRPESVPCGCEEKECNFTSGDNVEFGQTVQLKCPTGCTGTTDALCSTDENGNGNFEVASCTKVTCEASENGIKCENCNCTFDKIETVAFEDTVSITCLGGCSNTATCNSEGKFTCNKGNGINLAFWSMAVVVLSSVVKSAFASELF